MRRWRIRVFEVRRESAVVRTRGNRMYTFCIIIIIIIGYLVAFISGIGKCSIDCLCLFPYVSTSVQNFLGWKKRHRHHPTK